MSDNKHNRTRTPADAPEEKAHFFPVWAPLLVMIAVTLTGLVLAMNDNVVSTSYFVLFAIAAIGCTLLVEARGLFLTVAALPLYFLIGTGFIGWFAAGATGANSRKTKLITSVYPALDHFLWLLIPLVVSIVIAVLRWWFYREELARKQARAELARKRRADKERRNRESYTRVQSRYESGLGRVRSVEELRASAQKRRMPLPERRQSPSRYLDN